MLHYEWKKRKRRDHRLHLIFFFLEEKKSKHWKTWRIPGNLPQKPSVWNHPVPLHPAREFWEVKYLLKKQNYAENEVLLRGLKALDKVHFPRGLIWGMDLGSWHFPAYKYLCCCDFCSTSGSCISSHWEGTVVFISFFFISFFFISFFYPS